MKTIILCFCLYVSLDFSFGRYVSQSKGGSRLLSFPQQKQDYDFPSYNYYEPEPEEHDFVSLVKGSNNYPGRGSKENFPDISSSVDSSNTYNGPDDNIDKIVGSLEPHDIPIHTTHVVEEGSGSFELDNLPHYPDNKRVPVPIEPLHSVPEHVPAKPSYGGSPHVPSPLHDKDQDFPLNTGINELPSFNSHEESILTETDGLPIYNSNIPSPGHDDDKLITTGIGDLPTYNPHIPSPGNDYEKPIFTGTDDLPILSHIPSPEHKDDESILTGTDDLPIYNSNIPSTGHDSNKPITTGIGDLPSFNSHIPSPGYDNEKPILTGINDLPSFNAHSPNAGHDNEGSIVTGVDDLPSFSPHIPSPGHNDEESISTDTHDLPPYDSNIPSPGKDDDKPITTGVGNLPSFNSHIPNAGHDDEGLILTGTGDLPSFNYNNPVSGSGDEEHIFTGINDFPSYNSHNPSIGHDDEHNIGVHKPIPVPDRVDKPSYGSDDDGSFFQKEPEVPKKPDVYYASAGPHDTNDHEVYHSTPEDTSFTGKVSKWWSGVKEKARSYGSKVKRKFVKLGDKISNSFSNAKSNPEYNIWSKFEKYFDEMEASLKSIWDGFTKGMSTFSVMIQEGASFVAERTLLVFNKEEASHIINKMHRKMDEGNEIVSEFFQILGEKIAKWKDHLDQPGTDTGFTQKRNPHYGDPHYPDLFKDDDVQQELTKLVRHNVITQKESDLLSEVNQIKQIQY